MQEEHNEEFDSISEEIDSLEQRLEAAEKESREFFEQLQTSPHQFEAFFSDATRFTPKALEEIQKKKDALTGILERRLEEARKKVTPKKEKPNPPIGGHWIFVR